MKIEEKKEVSHDWEGEENFEREYGSSLEDDHYNADLDHDTDLSISDGNALQIGSVLFCFLFG